MSVYKKKNKVVGYLRVSGKSQIDKSGFDRQQEKIISFANESNFEIVKNYKEKAISGIAEQDERPAFQAMINDLLNNGVRTIVIERLARELRVQENLCVYIASKGLQLISANTGENITKAIEDDPMKKALIQIQGVF